MASCSGKEDCGDNCSANSAKYKDQLCSILDQLREKAGFVRLSKSKMFLEKASANFLLYCLEDDGIEDKEEEILMGVLRWLKHDWRCRKIHTAELLERIRLGLIPVNRVEQILGTEILAIPDCEEIVDNLEHINKVHGKHFETEEREKACCSLKIGHPHLFAPRNIVTAQLRLTGRDTVASTRFACYKINWHTEFPDKYPDVQKGNKFFCQNLIVGNNDNVYIAGARYGAPKEWVKENNFFKYDTKEHKWVVLAPMKHLTHQPQLFEVDGCIYTVGASRHKDDYTIQCYSLDQNEWEVVVSTEDIKMTVGEAVLIDNYILCHGEAKTNDDISQNKPATTKNKRENFYERFCVFDTTKKTWSNVYSNRVGQKDEVTVKLSTFDNDCYLEVFVENNKVSKFTTYRVACYLDSDNPRIKVGKKVDTEVEFDSDSPEYRTLRRKQTLIFDRNELQITKIECRCHTEDEGFKPPVMIRVFDWSEGIADLGELKEALQEKE